MTQADAGIEELIQNCDSLVVIPNDKLLDLAMQQKNTPLTQSFRIADDVLRQGVQGIAELIIIPGLVSLDFADVRSVMKDAGYSHMGIGRASGENRAEEATRMAINSPLLETSIAGAQGILLNISGGTDLGTLEISRANEIVQELAHPDAEFIFGAIIKEELGEDIEVTVVATGFDAANGKRPVNGFFSAGLGSKQGGASLDSEDVDVPPFIFNKR